MKKKLFLPILFVSAIILAGCSGDGAGVMGGNGGGDDPPPNAASSSAEATATQPPPELPTGTDEEMDIPIEELGPGILLPRNAVELEILPLIPRGEEANEAALFAQGVAAKYLYINNLFAPKPSGPNVGDVGYVNGLSLSAEMRWYELTKDEKTFQDNLEEIKGLLFVPEGTDGERGYGIPSTFENKFENLKVAQGNDSSIDGSPTLRVSFDLSGKVIWQEAGEKYYVAPFTRKISYDIAEENGEWVLDSWVPSFIIIGEEREATEEELFGKIFTRLEMPEPEPAPTEGVPTIPESELEDNIKTN